MSEHALKLIKNSQHCCETVTLEGGTELVCAIRPGHDGPHGAHSHEADDSKRCLIIIWKDA